MHAAISGARRLTRLLYNQIVYFRGTDGSIKTYVHCAATNTWALYDTARASADEVPPVAVVTGGGLATGTGALSGEQSVVFDAHDDGGIRSARLYVDGALVASRTFPCDDSAPVPCSNRTGERLTVNMAAPRDRSDGLTKAQAEKALRQIREIEAPRGVAPNRRVTMEEGGAELCRRLELKGRKKSHRLTVASDLRNHIVPFFGDRTLDRITPDDIERYIAVKQRTLAIKTIRNHIVTMHSVFEAGRLTSRCGAAESPDSRRRAPARSSCTRGR